MAPVVRALIAAKGVEARTCTTAQHRQLMDQVLAGFEIKPDYDLDLMRDNQSLSELSAAIFTGLEPVINEFRPDWILVEGDTTTVAIAALLAYYHRVHVGHVEAGLRTHDKWQPFPEEINRRVAGVVADLHFAPTEWARKNLLREGVQDRTIVITGNPVIDAVQVVAEQAEPDSVTELLRSVGIDGSPSTKRASAGRSLVLVTAHRRENFGRPLEEICRALKDLAARGDVEIVYAVHPNPNVDGPVRAALAGASHITLTPPLDYLPLVHLMKHARLILTDSGGIQEEAPAFGIPTLVLREVTERPEGVESGSLKLVGTDRKRIVAEANQLLDDPTAYAKMSKATNPYGDGHAAEKIVSALLAFQVQ